MTDALYCSECQKEIESAEELTAESEVAEVDVDDGGSISLYGNRDLFLCSDCGNPLGVSRT